MKLEQIKQTAITAASATGAVLSLAVNNSIGAAIHAIVETNQFLKQTIQSPLLRAAAAAGTAAAAYLQPRAVTLGLIAFSALKFGVNQSSGNLSGNFQKTIGHTPGEPVEEKVFEVQTPAELGSRANPIVLDDQSEVNEKFTPQYAAEKARVKQEEADKIVDDAMDFQFFGNKPSASLDLAKKMKQIRG